LCLAALEAGHAEIVAEERAASVPSAGIYSQQAFLLLVFHIHATHGRAQ